METIQGGSFQSISSIINTGASSRCDINKRDRAMDLEMRYVFALPFLTDAKRSSADCDRLLKSSR